MRRCSGLAVVEWSVGSVRHLDFDRLVLGAELVGLAGAYVHSLPLQLPSMECHPTEFIQES